MADKKKRKNPCNQQSPPSKKFKSDDNSSHELDKTIDTLYRIDKYDKLYFGWVCLRSPIWKELPQDLSHFISTYLSSEHKLMLFMHKNINTAGVAQNLWQFIMDAFWSHSLVNSGIKMKSIMYENKQYFQRSNLGNYQRPDDLVNKYEYDPDIYCDCNNGINVEWEIKPNNPDHVKYLYHYDKDNHHLCDEKPVFNEERFNLEVNEEYIFQKICNIISQFKLKNIFIGEEYNRGYDVKFVNPMGINDDHRGSTHCKIYLHCYQRQLIGSTQSISFRDLIDIYFKSKSHKFDFWYELYCYCNVEMKSLGSIKSEAEKRIDDENKSNLKIGTDKYLLITFNYDHGS